MKEKIEIVSVNKIKVNPNNPRLIKDEKFKKLVKSLQDTPQMIYLRPVIVNKDMIIIAGNMRYKACIELGYKEVPIINAGELTEEQERAIIIKDNVPYGEWDWDMLANEWDVSELEDFGLDIPSYLNSAENLDSFFEDNDKEIKEDTGKIILEYTIEEVERVKSELLKHGKTPEDAVYKLLGL